MSIYATLWTLKFPLEGDETFDCDWIGVRAQAVPPHIGTPTPGHGYEGGDPYADFLPPPIPVDEQGEGPCNRAVVFVTEHSIKGTERHPQEYVSPLLVLTGEEYDAMSFAALHRRLCDALRGNRAPVVAEVFSADGTHKVVRHGKPRSKVPADELDLTRPVELVVLSVKERSARCRPLGTDGTITLRASYLWTVVPGEIITVMPHKQWSYAGHPYLSGEVESARLDVAALGLTPLRLEEQGIWDPEQHNWGEENEPVAEWAKPIVARGLRPEYEMEHVLPGADPANIDSDPIVEASDREAIGDRAGANRILMDLCQADLRCLDAHAQLGNLAFDSSPKEALRHYEAGVRIGELSLGRQFDGLLPWEYIDNRPFLRCLSALGLCLWRLNRFQEAEKVFNRMLWLNPADEQGARFRLVEVKAEKPWKDESMDGRIGS